MGVVPAEPGRRVGPARDPLDARPQLLIETGTQNGGGALYYAALMHLYDPDTRVLTIDARPVEETRAVRRPRPVRAAGLSQRERHSAVGPARRVCARRGAYAVGVCARAAPPTTRTA